MGTEIRRNRNDFNSVENEKNECTVTIVYLISRYRSLIQPLALTPDEADEQKNARALIKDLIDRTLWAYSEVLGKYSKKQIWSRAALQAYQESHLDDICLEHPYERAKMKNELVSNDSFVGASSFEAVKDFLDRFCFGVVITRDEHRNLNKRSRDLGFENDSAWKEVYEGAGIILEESSE